MNEEGKDYMETSVGKTLLLFPGQGAQFVGMGRALAEAFPLAKERFAEADDILGINLFKIMTEGPEELLQQTEYAQPAIFTFSVTLYDLMLSEGMLAPDSLQGTLAAGHSLGEFSAVYAAGGYSFADGLRLVKRRGELMSESCKLRKGKMLAITRVNTAIAEKMVADFQGEFGDGASLVIANINSPKQVVVSGEERAVDAFAARCVADGVRCVPLKVAGAFHSSLMDSALPGWKEALSKVRFLPLRFPLILNVSGEAVSESGKLNDLLYRQLVCPVQWLNSMNFAINYGCEKFYEVGPGHVLAGLLVKIHPGFVAQSVLDTLNA